MTEELRQAKNRIRKLSRTSLERVLADCLLDQTDIDIIKRRLIGRESYVSISMSMIGYTPEAVGKRYRAALQIVESVAAQNGYFSSVSGKESGE